MRCIQLERIVKMSFRLVRLFLRKELNMHDHSKYALMSVYNKKDVEVFAKKLIELGYRIIATGGTKTYLETNGISCIEVSTFTDKAEIFDGRLKTISYEILGGILFDRQKESHKFDVEKYAIPHIDIVV